MRFLQLFSCVFIILYLLLAGACALPSETVNTAGKADVIGLGDAIEMHELFSEDRNGIYNYCPSVVQTDSRTRYVFYCSNKDPYNIIDYVYFRKGVKKGDNWIWGEKQLALAPSESGWDKQHVCDPDLVKGDFRYQGEKYNYVMFYLGVDVKTCKHNQIGMAFARNIEGPWVKWRENPVVAYDDYEFWGTGQPSAVSLEGTAGLRLCILGISKSVMRMLRIFQRRRR